MKKKTLVIILTIALLLPLLTVTAFAADLTNEDVVDAQGGFFRDLIKSIVNGFNSTIENFKNGISVIGDFFADIAKVISDAFVFLLDGMKRLFIPDKDYFPRIQERLQTAINKKIGGILSLTEYLKGRFSSLSVPANLDGMLVLEFPQGHIFGGTRIDLLGWIRGYIPLFRGLLSGLMVLTITVFAYRRVKSMINT